MSKFKGLFFAIILIISLIMNLNKKFSFLLLFFITSNFFHLSLLKADNHNIYETLEEIQKNIKTLEKAVYSESSSLGSNSVNSTIALDSNSEDVLTRHLLKLSEIESQF